MKRTGETIAIGKNWLWATWVLAMIALGLVASGWFLYLGLVPDRSGHGLTMVLFGLLGLAAFSGFALMILRTLRAPWHLELNPLRLLLHAPNYVLEVPWERVAGIAVGQVDGREGCVLAFDNPVAVAQAATFPRGRVPLGAVTGPKRMQSRMEDNLRRHGYHLGIPGRVLELAPEALARLLTQARTGELWQEGKASLPR